MTNTMFSTGTIWIGVVCILVLFLVFFKSKSKFIVKMVERAILGGFMIAGLNAAFAYFSLSFFVGINSATILVCALLGVPGVGLLYILPLI